MVFTLTLEQVKAIYRAGMRRGTNEATAFEWGCQPGGHEFDELTDELQEIMNEGKAFNDPGYQRYDEVGKLVRA